MSPGSGSAWRSTTKINIGRALLAGDGDGLTAAELESVLGQPHQSNLKKAAEQLAEDGAVETVKPPRQNGSPGRPAEVAFTFAEGERERFEELIEKEDDAGGLQVGMPLVFVNADFNRDDLLKILSLPGVLSGSGRAYELEGDGSQIMVSFSGPSAVDDSRGFLDLLDAKQLEAKRRFITKASGGNELRQAAKRHRQRLARKTEQLQSMQTAPRPER
jgi:hypothetical protein